MTRAAAAISADLRAPSRWEERVRAELLGNILPFWPRHVLDRARGGFFGAVGADLAVKAEAPRFTVVNSRILWTYSAAARLFSGPWREIADWAFDYIARHFWDRDRAGVFWTVDATGRPLSTRKQTYAQAFALYGFAEYYRLTGNVAALGFARRLFELIDSHCHDAAYGGYWEARGRDWEPLEDMRLSAKDLNCPKSMNTHLHILEGYTNLLRVWPDAHLAARQCELIDLMLERIVDAKSGHFKLFFDERWNSLLDHVSFGHDIEGSWLLVEAAEVLGDGALIARTREAAVVMARASAARGLDPDGSMFFEADSQGRLVNPEKHWWVQAEAVIGFYNAFEITGDVAFRTAALRAWEYIERHVVDREHGEWYAKLKRDGTVIAEAEDPEVSLVGPWKCPYHNARVCYEMLERLGRSEKKTP